MSTINVSAAWHTLFCFHGADEEESEPYLWTIMFTIDGRTISQSGSKLQGSPGFFFSPGSHGNLGGGINTGETRPIPRAVGRFDTTLQPIPITVGSRTVEIPGQLGMLAVLLEENSTSNDAAEAAHQAINELVKVELQEGIDGLNIDTIASEAGPAIAAGTDPVTAVMPIFNAQMQHVVDRIQRVADDVATAALVHHLSGLSGIIEGADHDDSMGMAMHFFSQGQLEATTNSARSDFSDRIAQPGPAEASDFNYNLHGEAWQRAEITFTPVTDQVPPGRFQVTGITKEASSAHNLFISHLGGQFPDGTPWRLEKGTVMHMIQAGSHSFFVRSADGRDADVFVDPNDANPNFPFLATTADNDPTNNLGNLPACQVSIKHTVDVLD